MHVQVGNVRASILAHGYTFCTVYCFPYCYTYCYTCIRNTVVAHIFHKRNVALVQIQMFPLLSRVARKSPSMCVTSWVLDHQIFSSGPRCFPSFYFEYIILTDFFVIYQIFNTALRCSLCFYIAPNYLLSSHIPQQYIFT